MSPITIIILVTAACAIAVGLTLSLLSIQKMAHGQEEYYTRLAAEDYFLAGGEPEGHWFGLGAKDLGLDGQVVSRENLHALLCGFNPRTHKPLTQNSGEPDHQPGWDLTFSAPKSVSVLWALAPADVRQVIQEAHDKAVKVAIGYLQDVAATTRRGKGGQVIEEARLIMALFEHGTSRALDPQIHTHALAMNVCTRADGTTGTIVSRPIYRDKMVAGALYRAELAHKLREQLGLSAELDERSFKLPIVPQFLCDFFSKRRAKIEEALGRIGCETATAAAFAALDTREKKGVVPPRRELFENWQREADRLGVAFERLAVSQLRPRQTIEEHVRLAIEKITESQSHFTEKTLLIESAILAAASGHSVSVIRAGVKAALDAPNVVTLCETKDEKQYTTHSVFQLERELIKEAKSLAADKKHGTTRSKLTKAIKAYRSEQPKHRINWEQRKALRHLLYRGGGAIRILEGLPGTAKSSLLNVAQRAWANAGYNVLGISLAGKAAKELEKASGITSTTLELLNLRMRPTAEYRWRHFGQQLIRWVSGQRTYPLKPLRLTKKTVVVVDEAGMVSTRQLIQLVKDVAKAGAMLVMVGDRKQLQAIESGGGFAFLGDLLGRAELKTILRQREWEDTKNVIAVLRGRPTEALKNLASRGLVTVAKDRREALAELVESWAWNERKDRSKAIIVAPTRQEAATLNEWCQLTRIRRKEIDRDRRLTVGNIAIHVGDRVTFTKTSYRIGVFNGEFGTVNKINRLTRVATIIVDGGDKVRVPLFTFRDLTLGYAATTHKLQGTTVESSYILAGGSMQDKELAVVQISRAKGTTRVFIDKAEAGEELTELAKKMQASHEKTIATAIDEEVQRASERQSL